MCHSDDSRPPAAPAARATAARSAASTLTSSDGTVVLSHEATSSDPTGVGFVVLPDVRGLHQFYRDLTERLAETGGAAVAIDYFGRTAGTDDRSDSFEFRPHVAQTTPAGVAADVQAGVARVRELGADRVFTLGFCFGGGMSWRQSADTPGLAGCIGFYGRVGPALEVAPAMQAPLLMLIAGADAHIPVEESRALADRAAVEAEFVVFEGAPHSFFDRTAAEHAAAAERAWECIQAFVAG
ncbi:MAG: Dienelactone hydrolase family [Frankiales bacterium]|nr:Dienelactone hydrolase family [Frankiales bacterium]